MRTATVLLPMIALAACASAPRAAAPEPAAPRQAVALAVDQTTVWQAALGTVIDRSMMVKGTDRASGIITTEEVVIAATGDRQQAGACAKVMGMPLRPNRAQYTIAVSGDNPTTLRVTARLTLVEQGRGGPTVSECTSAGVLESRLEQAIRDRGERK